MAILADWFMGHALNIEVVSAAVPDRIDLPGLQAREVVVLVDRTAARKGGPDAWMLRQGSVTILARLQFTAPDTFLQLPADPTAPIRLARLGGDDTLSLLGRVIWTGILT